VPLLATDLDVGVGRAHGVAHDEHALDEFVGVVAHDFPVLAGAWFGFVCVDHELVGAAALLGVGHEGVLQARGEACASAAAQPTGLELVNDPLLALVDQRAGLVPVSPLKSSF